MNHLRRVLVFVIAITASILPLDARAQDRAKADTTLSPYFFVEGGDPSLDKLPLKDTQVDVAISGVIADVTVRQVYENHGTRPLHARYVFPASTRAAVYGLTMTVGNVRTVAKIRERQQAVREFEAAKSEGKNAALLEQSRANVFSMKVANVMPGDTVVVELKYTELLVPTDGVYEFVYPTVVGPRYSEKTASSASPGDEFVKAPYTHEGDAPLSSFHLAGVVSTGVPMHDLASPSHKLVVRSNAPQRAELTLADSELQGGNRDFILRYRLAGEKIASGLLLYEGRDENFFLLMAEPPQVVTPDQIPPREYVFVLDVSGSMHGYPLDTAKKLMTDLATVLRPADTFNVLVFADGYETFSRVSVPATPANLNRALRFIGSKQGGGGTQLLGALKNAVALPRETSVSRSVVLVTDGYIDTEAEVFDYIREHLDEVNFFAFGIGSSVNRLLIDGVAHAGLGEPFIVTQESEAADAAAKLRRYIDSPVLTGIDVKFSGFDAYDVEPGSVPDLFASRPIIVFGKWRGSAAGSIEITGHSGRGPYQASIPVSRASVDERHAALRHLWARTRIAELADFGSVDETKAAAITKLGLTYGLLTRYTSFVAVQEVVRTSDAGDEVDQPLPLPQGVSDLAVGVQSGSEPQLLWVAVLMAVVSGYLRLQAVRRRRPGAAA